MTTSCSSTHDIKVFEVTVIEGVLTSAPKELTNALFGILQWREIHEVCHDVPSIFMY